MHTAHLDKITIGPFRSFLNPVTIEFPDHGLVLLQGESGSGKSSINLAIAYALDHSPYPATELASWDSKEPATVELTINGNTLKKGSKPSLKVAGEKPLTAVKVIKEKLKETIGINPEVLAARTYRGQRQPGLFLSKTDSEKKEFLIQLLPELDKFEKEVLKTELNIKKLNDSLNLEQMYLYERENRLKGLNLYSENELQPIKDSINLLETEAFTVGHELIGISQEITAKEKETETAIKGLNDASKPIQTDLFNKWQTLVNNKPNVVLDTTAISHIEASKAECEKRVSVLSSQDIGRFVEYKDNVNTLNIAIRELSKKLGSKTFLQNRAIEKNKEIKELEANKCPTCDREWDNCKELKQKLISEVTAIEEEVNALNLTELVVKTKKKELEDLGQFQANPMIANIEKVFNNLNIKLAEETGRLTLREQEALSGYNKDVIEAKTAWNDFVQGTATRISNIQKKLSDENFSLLSEKVKLTEKQSAIRSKLWEKEASLTTIQGKIEEYKQSVKSVEEQRLKFEQIKTELNAEKDYLRLIGREGFLGAIFEEVLQEIADETNAILGTVKNTENVMLEFKTESIAQNGNIKKNIIPVVKIRDKEVPLHSGLSGGMLSSTELAVDLALGEVISRRTGVDPGWLILDESFEGLDGPSKESCMEILNTYAHKKLVIVVDHSTEFKSLFTKIINVVNENGVSCIT